MKLLPDLDDDSKAFTVRWNTLTRILLVESSIKLIARTAMDYADFDTGENCHPSNDRLSLDTGYNERTVRAAWSVMRGIGIAKRVSRGTSYRRLADKYTLRIPEHWRDLPILGPHAEQFSCLYCGKQFVPQCTCTVNDRESDPEGGDVVRFELGRACFCPPPRANKGRDVVSCQQLWNESQAEVGAPTWAEIGSERWKLFRQARGDDW